MFVSENQHKADRVKTITIWISRWDVIETTMIPYIRSFLTTGINYFIVFH